ncbi:MAG: hypothetical protein R8L58_06640 [Mariprofundaceae bacterium]
MANVVRFSFALSPRMRSFLELRDALSSLDEACRQNQARNWLHAVCDLRASLLGEQGRKCVLPELIGLLVAMQAHLTQLAGDIPQYQASIDQTCAALDQHIQTLQSGLPDITSYLAQDALINAYLNTQKKQDWLGHKIGLPQSLGALWQGAENRSAWLQQGLTPLSTAVRDLDQMLNDYVQWEERTAEGGSGQISPERGVTHGLLVIGLPAESVAQGIIPDISGNKLAIRLRFQRWQPGEPPLELSDDQPYAMMLIPIA